MSQPSAPNMGANVVDLPLITTIDTPPQRILTRALSEELSGVVICGYRMDGSEYFASSFAGGPEALWSLARAQHRLLRQLDTNDDE